MKNKSLERLFEYQKRSAFLRHVKLHIATSRIGIAFPHLVLAARTKVQVTIVPRVNIVNRPSQRISLFTNKFRTNEFIIALGQRTFEKFTPPGSDPQRIVGGVHSCQPSK